MAIIVLLHSYPPNVIGNANLSEAVKSRLTKEIGKRNFQPKSSNWSIRTLGVVHLNNIAKKTKRYALRTVITIPIDAVAI